jgi:hypothetical protein
MSASFVPIVGEFYWLEGKNHVLVRKVLENNVAMHDMHPAKFNHPVIVVEVDRNSGIAKVFLVSLR